MVEHTAVNRGVVGSSPTRGASVVHFNLIRPHGQAVKTSPFHGGNTSSNLVGVTQCKLSSNIICIFSIELCFLKVIGSNPITIWTFSSVGQSNRLITGRSWVRVPEGPLTTYKINKRLWPGGSAGQSAALSRRRSWVRTPSGSFHLGILAQLGEHLPYKQRVTGSSPVGPTYN